MGETLTVRRRVGDEGFGRKTLLLWEEKAP
jgi:hypothetical protein